MNQKENPQNFMERPAEKWNSYTHKKGISAQHDMKSRPVDTSNQRNEKKNNNLIYCPQCFQLSMSNMAHSKYFCGCVQYTTNFFFIRYKKTLTS